jgi:hypothetical protein
MVKYNMMVQQQQQPEQRALSLTQWKCSVCTHTHMMYMVFVTTRQKPIGAPWWCRRQSNSASTCGSSGRPRSRSTFDVLRMRRSSTAARSSCWALSGSPMCGAIEYDREQTSSTGAVEGFLREEPVQVHFHLTRRSWHHDHEQIVWHTKVNLTHHARVFG